MGKEYISEFELLNGAPSGCPKCGSRWLAGKFQCVTDFDAVVYLDRAEIKRSGEEETRDTVCFSLECPKCGEIELDDVEAWKSGELVAEEAARKEPI